MLRFIFIDGYNVINSWPNLKEIKEYNYGQARKDLLDTLQNYSSFNQCKIYLVYDAHKVKGNIEKQEEMGGVTVVFTKDGETADSFIEKKVNDIGKKVEVTVVTSDNLEQQTIFQRGATRMSSLDFYNEVLIINQKIRKKAEKCMIGNKKNLLGDRLEEDVWIKLEEMRRSK